MDSFRTVLKEIESEIRIRLDSKKTLFHNTYGHPKFQVGSYYEEAVRNVLYSQPTMLPFFIQGEYDPEEAARTVFQHADQLTYSESLYMTNQKCASARQVHRLTKVEPFGINEATEMKEPGIYLRVQEMSRDQLEMIGKFKSPVFVFGLQMFVRKKPKFTARNEKNFLTLDQGPWKKEPQIGKN